jgi:hypothetical protein
MRSHTGSGWKQRSGRDVRRVVEGVGGKAKLVHSLEFGRYRRDRATAAESCSLRGGVGLRGREETRWTPRQKSCRRLDSLLRMSFTKLPFVRARWLSSQSVVRSPSVSVTLFGSTFQSAGWVRGLSGATAHAGSISLILAHRDDLWAAKGTQVE